MLPNYSDNPLNYYRVLETLTPEQLNKEWKPASEDHYNEMLEALPPIRMSGGAFMVGEPMMHTPSGVFFEAFIKIGDNYWHRPALLHKFSPTNYRKEIQELTRI